VYLIGKISSEMLDKVKTTNGLYKHLHILYYTKCIDHLTEMFENLFTTLILGVLKLFLRSLKNILYTQKHIIVFLPENL